MLFFNEKNITQRQAIKSKQIDKKIVKELKSWIKYKIKDTIEYCKGKEYFSFSVDRLPSILNYTYKEFKQLFYDIVVPYFIDKGFKVTFDEYETCTITWGKAKDNIEQ